MSIAKRGKSRSYFRRMKYSLLYTRRAEKDIKNIDPSIKKHPGQAIKKLADSWDAWGGGLHNKTYSGKFMVRVPPEGHRKLAIRAAEAGVSLNRIVSAKLST